MQLAGEIRRRIGLSQPVAALGVGLADEVRFRIARSEQDPQAGPVCLCFGGEFGLRVDLATDESADPTGQSDVDFATESGSQTLSMIFEEMDGRHATSFSTDGPLVQLLQSGASLSVHDVAGAFAEHQFSLAGSSKAIGALLQACN